MKCNVCNAEITEGQAFCSYCGTKIEPPQTVTAETYATTESAVQQPVITSDLPASDTTKNAKIGLIFGILSVAISCLGLIFGIIGLTNSIKGMKTPTAKGMAIPGMILSIVGIVSSFFSVIYLFAFIYGIAMGIMEESIPSYLITVVSNLL